MPTIRFEPRTAGGLKPNPTARVEYFDADLPGLALRVTPTGVKTWTVLYRHRGRLRRYTLGPLKAIGLAEARERAREAIRDASKGGDPATTKQAQRKAETIADLAREYIDRYAKRHKRSWREDDRILRAEILPTWKHRAIADITRRDVRRLVEGIAERGAGIMANRTAALVSKLFKFALDDELIDASPAVRIPRPAPERRRDRVLSPDEIRALWEAWDGLSPEMAAFYRLRLITAQRGGEVAAMRWQDVDLDARTWTVPATIAKNKLAHRVPLSATALDLLTALRTEAADDAVYVLAGARGKRQQSEAAATFPVQDFKGHDLRRTAASQMGSGGIARLTIGKILNHVERDVTAIYDRHGYDAEKRAALDWWAIKLTAILEKQDGKVLPFARG